jgi:hypothetical protein
LILFPGNTEKLRQVQSIHQQIIQFITNPTYETLANAKHFRDMLDRIPVNKFFLYFKNKTNISNLESSTTTTTITPNSNEFSKQCI